MESFKIGQRQFLVIVIRNCISCPANPIGNKLAARMFFFVYTKPAWADIKIMSFQQERIERRRRCHGSHTAVFIMAGLMIISVQYSYAQKEEHLASVNAFEKLSIDELLMNIEATSVSRRLGKLTELASAIQDWFCWVSKAYGVLPLLMIGERYKIKRQKAAAATTTTFNVKMANPRLVVDCIFL